MTLRPPGRRPPAWREHTVVTGLGPEGCVGLGAARGREAPKGSVQCGAARGEPGGRGSSSGCRSLTAALPRPGATLRAETDPADAGCDCGSRAQTRALSVPGSDVCSERLWVQRLLPPGLGNGSGLCARLCSGSWKGAPRERGRQAPHLLGVGGGHLRDARDLDAAPRIFPQFQKAGGRVQEVPDHFVVNLG